MLDSESNFKKLLLKDGSVIEQVLSESEIEQARKTNSMDLKIYLSKHLPRLIRIAFREDTKETTLTALKLLTGGSQFVIPNLVKSSYFPEFVMKTLAKPSEITSAKIGRICDITLSIFQSGKANIINNYGYILFFLQYCENSSAYSMFQTILTEENEKMQKCRDWLFDIGFVDELSSNIIETIGSTFLTNNIEESNSKSSYNYDHEKLINLLRLVSDAAKGRPNIKKDFISSHLKTILNVSYSRNFPYHISDYYWEAINVLYESDSSEFFIDIANTAQKMIISISKSDENHIHKYLSESLNFMTKFIGNKPELVNSELLVAISSLMTKFSTSSFFLCDVRRFFQECIKTKELKEKVPLAVILSLLQYGKDTGNGLVSFFAKAIIEDMTKSETAKKAIKKMDEVSKFIKHQIEPLSKKREFGYTDKYAYKDCKPVSKKKSFF